MWYIFFLFLFNRLFLFVVIMTILNMTENNSTYNK